ncbi:MAG: hypothetical protein IT434_01740 [Phycisphaerales bacterium]|jgi:hypothetical protein|nr:hypothetical protein [Phycisphaerales bacterium]
MFRHVKTFILVTFVTALIWIFAEGESLTRRSLKADVFFESDAAGERVIAVSDAAWRDRVDIVVQGTASAVTEAESVLRRAVRLRPGMSGVPSQSGEFTVDLEQALSDAPELAAAGITIARADPPAVTVRIDQLQEKTLPVVLDAPGVDIEGPAEVTPSSVKLRLPAEFASRLTPDTPARVRIPAETLAKLVPGRKESIASLPIELPTAVVGAHSTKFDPPTCSVSITLRNNTASHKLSSVPVFIKLAAVEMGKWDITINEADRFLTDVTVTGPSDLVERVRRGDLKVVATVPLSFEELERAIAAKDALFSDLPAALRFEVQNARVRLDIQRRDVVGPPLPRERQPGP